MTRDLGTESFLSNNKREIVKRKACQFGEAREIGVERKDVRSILERDGGYQRIDCGETYTL